MIMSRSISKSSEILNPQPISRKPMKPINLLVFDSDGVLTSGGAALPIPIFRHVQWLLPLSPA